MASATKDLSVPSDLRKRWATNLREARKRAGYETQAEFAHALGCTRAAVNAWERGIRAPSFHHRAAIAELLRRNPARLFPAA